MKIISKTETGNHVIDEETTLQGTLMGQTTVRDGATFIIRGCIMGDLIIECESTVEVSGTGTVTGHVTNRGGALTIYGMVTGNVMTMSGGKATLGPGGKVMGTVGEVEDTASKQLTGTTDSQLDKI